MKPLQGYQRKHLRELAHPLKPVVQVGVAGISEEVVAATNQALLDHELIKVRLHEPEDKRAMAEELAARCEAHLCGLVGHTVMLYKPHPEKPTIKLPRR
jgi:RNA-binding protein